MIFETYEFRKRRENKTEPDVYRYDVAPKQLRHQICVALEEGIGSYIPDPNRGSGFLSETRDCWDLIDEVCVKEVDSYLIYRAEYNLKLRVFNFIMNSESIDQLLSVIEIACRALAQIDNYYESPRERDAKQTGKESITEINQRFEQHAVGYQYEDPIIIRVDSKHAHAEIIKPALVLLKDPIFSKVNEDFIIAHKHYREGHLKDSVTAANRAFECMLKAICDAENWPYDKGSSASNLVSVVQNKKLFTHDFDRIFAAWAAMLKNGLSSVRNDAGAHGEGAHAAAVTKEIARFAINLAASNILFLGESYKALKARREDVPDAH